MFCSNCGAEIHDGKFCSECGAPIQLQQIILPVPAQQVKRIDLSVRLGSDKYYRKDEKVINAALAHNVLADANEVIIYAGSYFANLDSYFLFVNTDEVIFCKINEKKPETDIVTRIDYSDSRLDGFYDTKWSKFRLKEEDIGFKPRKICTYIDNWKVIYNEVQRIRGKEYKNLNEKPVAPRLSSFTSASTSAPISKKDRITQNKANGVACCPKCGSTSLSANKKGFGVGKAVVGAWALGPVGLVAGNAGAKKVIVTCLSCGHQWKV